MLETMDVSPNPKQMENISYTTVLLSNGCSSIPALSKSSQGLGVRQQTLRHCRMSVLPAELGEQKGWRGHAEDQGLHRIRVAPVTSLSCSSVVVF